MRTIATFALLLLLGAPTLQQALVPEPRHKTAPGYTVFERPNGILVSHRLHEESATFDEAEKICDSEGASLSGVDSIQEAEFLKGLVKPAQSNNHFWIGGRRNPSCFNVKGFVKNGSDPCSRDRVVTWQNSVASTIKDGWWRDHPCNSKDCVKGPNPSSEKFNKTDETGFQACLSFVAGTPYWADNNTAQFLDDTECTSKYSFFCQRPLIVSHHRLFTEALNHTDAQQKCEETGGKLAGINSEKDVNELEALIKEHGLKSGLFWIGGKRDPNCYTIHGYVNETGHPCSRENVVKWMDGVGTKIKSTWWRDHSCTAPCVQNPSSYPGIDGGYGVQACLAFAHGQIYWAADTVGQFLDDVHCKYEQPFFCSYD